MEEQYNMDLEHNIENENQPEQEVNTEISSVADVSSPEVYAEELDETTFDNYDKAEVVKAMEECAKETDVLKIKSQVALLRSRFLQLLKENKEQGLQLFLSNGGAEEDFKYQPDELDQRFDAAFGNYKANKTRYMESLEKEKEENLRKKRTLLDELKELVDSEQTLKQIYDRFNEIQVKWKEIGPVPQIHTNELWQNYHFYVEKFFNKVKMNRELRDLDMKKNLEQKLQLCEKTEALLLEESSIMKSFKLLQQYHQEWKEIGAVEEDKKEELWNRFKLASDKINQKRKEHYEQIAKEQENNYQAKLALCEQLETLLAEDYKSSLKTFYEAESKVNALFEMWRTLGPAPKQVHEEIWQRFRQDMNIFFEDKKEFLKKNKEEQQNNYNLKLNLCMQAEAIALRQDWKKATADLLKLQEEWKKIGTVSRKHSEQLWKRFRKACDDFFEAKSEHYKEIVEKAPENLEKRKELLQKAKDFVFSEVKNENVEALKLLKREWAQIGYTEPKEKEKIQKEFDEIIGQHLDKLKISLGDESYSERIVRWKEEGINALKNEKRRLQGEIEKKSKDLLNLENNIQFLGKSKGADSIRTQIEEKIEHAKKTVVDLKEKLNLIINEIKDQEKTEK